jgi:chromosome segregation ATPase
MSYQKGETSTKKKSMWYTIGIYLLVFVTTTLSHQQTIFAQEDQKVQHTINNATSYSPDEINTLYDKIQQDSDFQEKLKQFQEQELSNLVSQTSLNDSAIQARQKEIGGIYDELQNIQTQFDTISTQKKFLDNRISETKQTIQLIIDQAKKTQAETDQILQKVTKYTTTIKNTKTLIDQTNKDKERARSMAAKFLTILYKLSNELYTADSEIDDIKLFLKSENISTSLSNTELLQMISLRYEQLIGFIYAKQVSLKELLSQLESAQLKVKQNLQEYRKKLDTLNQQKEYLIEYINVYKISKD